MNKKFTFLLILLMTLGSNLNAQKLIVVKENVVYLLNFNYSFTRSTGSDGVKISYPYSGWTTSTGSDGRKIAYPYSGWTTSTGSDGRKIAYPYSGWTTSTGSDGRKIAYPYSWSVSSSNGRKYAEIMEVDGGLAIVYQRAEIAAKIEKIIEDFDMDTAYDYALYLLINENFDD